MISIPCQKPDHNNGCYSCGGFKVVLEKLTLTCGCEAWFRPLRGTTIYDGKTITSFDGLDCVYQEDGLKCVECGGEDE